MADAPHRPVLLDEAVDLLRPQPGQWHLDCTAGAGGHAERVLALCQPDGKLIGLDRDPAALEIARQRLQSFGSRVTLVHANFTDAAAVLAQHQIGKVHAILFDFGLSSIQLADAARGFSFQHEDAPLDMRADSTAGPTAGELLARATEREIADVLWQYADERKSRRIARAIVEERKRRPIRTAGQLAAIVLRAIGGPWQRIHPATRTFMALRMWVNRELENLEETLAAVHTLVKPGGRVVAISFHSKEDAIVKRIFREQAKQQLWTILTAKPLMAGDAEIAGNPRARSARLRAVERTDVETGS